MSAYVVPKSHIDALLRVGLDGPSDRAIGYPGNGWYSGGAGVRWYAGDPREAGNFAELQAMGRSLTHESADEVGAMLAAENVRSVQHAYPGAGMDTLPGPIANGWATDALLGRYTYPLHGTGPVRIGLAPRRLSAVEALKAIAGYEYQSCEHPGWSTSEARRFCDALRHRVIGALPGFEEADTWEVSAAS